MEQKRLYRNIDKSAIGGVASGLGDFFNMDYTLFRVLFVLATVFGGGGLIIYIVLWIFVPVTPIVRAESSSATVEAIHPDEENKVPEAIDKKNNQGGIIAGLILISIGLVFILNIFCHIRFRMLWPLAIIAAGAVIIISGFTNKRQK